MLHIIKSRFVTVSIIRCWFPFFLSDNIILVPFTCMFLTVLINQVEFLYMYFFDSIMVGKGAGEWAKNHGIEHVSPESLKTGIHKLF